MAPNQSFAFPSSQSYYDYMQLQSGFPSVANQSTFPAETSMPTAQVPRPQPQVAPKKNPLGQVVGTAQGVKNLYDTGQAIFGSPPSAAPAMSSLPSATTSGMSGVPAGYSATETALGMGPSPAPYGYMTNGAGEAIGTAAPNLAAQAPTTVSWAAPAGSNAAALGSTISSGLEAAGMGAETAGYVGSGLGTAIPVAGGLYGAYRLGQNLSDNRKDFKGGAMAGAATGAAIGSIIPGVGTLIGAGLGGLIGGGAGGLIGGDKGGNQLMRDQARSAAQQQKWLDKDFKINLADGSSLDLGKDVGKTYTNAAGEKRTFNNWDENDPLAQQGIGWLKPLGAIFGRGQKDMSDSFTAQLYNELVNDGSIKDMDALRTRVVSLYNQLGMKPSMVVEAVKAMGLPQNEKDAMIAAALNLKKGQAPQLKPGERIGPGGLLMGAPKDTNIKPMGTGAVKPTPKPAQPLSMVEKR